MPFCQLCTTRNSTLNEHGTQHCLLHSLEHERQSIPDSATFSSNKISQHNFKLPTYHADPTLLTVSAYKTDYTCHAQQQLHWLQSILYPTKCFIGKKLMFRLLILQSSSCRAYSAVFCACCVCSNEEQSKHPFFF